MEISLNDNKRKVLDNKISGQLKQKSGPEVGQALLKKQVRHLKRAIEIIYTYLGYDITMQVLGTCKDSLETYHNSRIGKVMHAPAVTSKPEVSE